METVYSTHLAACNIYFGKCFADPFLGGSDTFSKTQQISLCLFQSIGFMLSVNLKLLGKCQLLFRLENWIHNLFSFFTFQLDFRQQTFKLLFEKLLALIVLHIYALLLREKYRLFCVAIS